MKDLVELVRQEELFEEYRMLQVEINNLKNKHYDLSNEVEATGKLIQQKQTVLARLWQIVRDVIQNDIDPIEAKLRLNDNIDYTLYMEM